MEEKGTSYNEVSSEKSENDFDLWLPATKFTLAPLKQVSMKNYETVMDSISTIVRRHIGVLLMTFTVASRSTNGINPRMNHRMNHRRNGKHHRKGKTLKPMSTKYET